MQLEDEKPTAPFEAGVDWLVLGEDMAPEQDEPFAEFVETHVDALLRFAAVAGPEPDRARGLVGGALATAYRRWRDITEGDERPLVEVGGLVARRISRLASHRAEVEARHEAWRAGWRARPEGLGSDEDDLGPSAISALLAEVHVRVDAWAHLRSRGAGPSDPLRRALDRMMPDDRLAGALHEVLGLDEREVAVALRIPWLHAVARIARAEARGPELLLDAGVHATLGEALALVAAASGAHPAPGATGRARRRARWTGVGAGAAIAAVIGLVALGLPSLADRTPERPASPGASAAVQGTAPVVPPVFAVGAGAGVTQLPCPTFPDEPPHPIYHGPPVTDSLLLTADDFALPGTVWTRLGGAYVPALPASVVDGVAPVLPLSQAVGIADTLVTVSGGVNATGSGGSAPPPSVVQQLVVRFDRGRGALAARRIARQLQCHDAQHDVRLMQRQDGETVTVRAYAQGPRAAAGAIARFDTWLLLVRSDDLVSVLRIGGDLASHPSRAGSAALAAAALARLEGHEQARFS